METGRRGLSTVCEWGVGLAGLVAACLYLPQITRENLFVTLFLLALAIYLEAHPVPMGKVDGSLLIALPIASMVVYSDADAVWLMVVAELVSPFVRRTRRPFSISWFNAGQYALCTVAMAGVFHWVHAGEHPEMYPLLGVLCGCVTFMVVNHGFVHLLAAARGTFEWRDVSITLREDSLHVLVALPFAMLMIGVSPFHPLLGPLTLLPIAILGHMMWMYRRLSVLQRIHAVAAQLTSEFDIERICAEVAQAARSFTYADAVVVYTTAQNGRRLVPRAVAPESERPGFEGEQTASLEHMVWNVIESCFWRYIPDARKDSHAKAAVHDTAFASAVVFPMLTHGQPQGAIVCCSTRPYGFNEFAGLIAVLAAQVAVLLENARLYRNLQEQLSRDGATGLYNYRFFYEALALQVERARRNGTPVSVAVVDVDYFKKFNDTYGHLAGDVVLRSVGQLLAEHAGPDAVVARYGGEEFAIIKPCDPDEMFAVVEKIRHAVSHHVVDFNGYRLQGITVSSGIASFPHHGSSDRDVLLKADSAMYWGAKQRGRNRTAMYSPEFDTRLFVDGLTGLMTYHFVNIRVLELFEAGVQRWGAVCVDVEHLAYVNSTFGFHVGDQVLQETSFVIKECLRQSELACRYGGDEFLVLLPGVTQSEIDSVAERISKAVAAHRFQCLENVVMPLHIKYRARSWDDLTGVGDLFDRVGQLFAELGENVGESLA
ncbi:MAG: sensor domain-containing diguanylate cyclase [Alicyclobacillaceae bacterium]|nr:sensor domain-containing diguanylate cyclase [Alicyclobacillaceae bacterium]